MIIKSDFLSNRKNTKGLLFIILLRMSHFFTQNIFLKIIGLPLRVFYNFFIEWIIEIPDSMNIGNGFRVYR